jgi:DNA-binding transcriptional MerR regulator
VFAARGGVSVRTVRYYEELGLLRAETRSRGGFRLYGEEDHKRLAVISFLKSVGLPLSEVRRILLAKQEAGGEREAIAYLLGLFREKLTAIESRISTLNAVRAEFSRAIGILSSCQDCCHERLLDARACCGCASLGPKGEGPDLFREIMT